MSNPVSLPRTAKGKRPQFFDDASIDHLVTMVMEMSTELYTVYARLDNLERFLASEGMIDREKLDNFLPDEAAQADRLAWRELFLDRLLRTVKADRG